MQEMSGYLKDLVSAFHGSAIGVRVFLPSHHSPDLHPCLISPRPGTYIPQKEVQVVEIIQATVIRQNQALRLRARKECRDRDGKERVTGGVSQGPRGWWAGYASIAGDVGGCWG